MRIRFCLLALSVGVVACGGDEPTTITKKAGSGGRSGGAGASAAAGAGGSAAGASAGAAGISGGGAGGSLAGGFGGSAAAGTSAGGTGGTSPGGSAGSATFGGGAGAVGGVGGGGGNKLGLCEATAPPITSFKKITTLTHPPNTSSGYFMLSGKYLVLDGPVTTGATEKGFLRVDVDTGAILALPAKERVGAQVVGNVLYYIGEGGVLQTVPVDQLTPASVVPDARVAGKKVARFAVDAQGICWSEEGFGVSPVHCSTTSGSVVAVPDAKQHDLALVGGDVLELVDDGSLVEDHDLRVDAWKRDGTSTSPSTWTTVTGLGVSDWTTVGDKLAFLGGKGHVFWASSVTSSVVEDVLGIGLTSDGTAAWGASLCSVIRVTPDGDQRLRVPVVPSSAVVAGQTVYIHAANDAATSAVVQLSGIYSVSLADFQALAK